MTPEEMWDVCAETALLLDASASDWSRLLEIEEMLWPLANELVGEAEVWATRASNTRRARAADRDVQLLRESLSWVRQHAYDSLESDLQSRLRLALQCAVSALDRLEPVAEDPVA